MLFHDRQMYGITCGHLPASHHNLLRSLGCSAVYSKHLIGDAQ